MARKAELRPSNLPEQDGGPRPQGTKRGGCIGEGKDGKPCRATPRTGSPWCINCDPDPEVRARIAAARRQGGRKRMAGARELPPVEAEAWMDLRTVEDARAGFAWAIRGVATGALEPRQANALGLLLSGGTKVLTASLLCNPDFAAAAAVLAKIARAHGGEALVEEIAKGFAVWETGGDKALEARLRAFGEQEAPKMRVEIIYPPGVGVPVEGMTDEQIAAAVRSGKHLLIPAP